MVVTARFQFACRHLVVDDIEQQERLHRVDFQHAQTFKFILDDIQQEPVQTFNQRKAVQIAAKHCPIVTCRDFAMKTHDLVLLPSQLGDRV